MSARIAKAGKAALLKPVVKVPEAQLTEMEMRIALAFRRFKPEMKTTWLETMENIATNYEIEAAAARPARSLRMVKGGAK